MTTMEQNAWYVNFFGQDYLNIYRHTLTGERTEKEVAFAERKLALDAPDGPRPRPGERGHV